MVLHLFMGDSYPVCLDFDLEFSLSVILVSKDALIVRLCGGQGPDAATIYPMLGRAGGPEVTHCLEFCLVIISY